MAMKMDFYIENAKFGSGVSAKPLKQQLKGTTEQTSFHLSVVRPNGKAQKRVKVSL